MNYDIAFNPRAFQFEWPAIEMHGAPIVWHKLGSGLVKLEIRDPVTCTVSQASQSGGEMLVGSGRNAGAISEIVAPLSQ